VTPLASRVRRLLCAIARLAAAAACLGGLPYTLARLDGWPLPRHLRTWSQLPALLASPMSSQDILKIVACAVWLGWAVFALSVIAEVAAAARGRPAPKLPGTGPVQALAAALLGTTVLTAIMQASPLAALPAALTAHAAPAAWTQPARSRPAAAAADAEPAGARAAGTGHGLASRHGTPRVRIHRVVEGDNLWDIAERYLDDGERWHEIFALNQGRPQPGGQELTDPDLIEPGWVLRLPPAPLTRPAPAGRAQVPRPARPARPPARAQAPPHARRARPRAFTPQHHRPERGGPGISLPSGGLAGIGLAAAVTTALVLAGVRRRRRYRPGHGLSSSLKPAWAHLPPAIATLRRATASQRPATTNATANADPGRAGAAAVPADAAGRTGRGPSPWQTAGQAPAATGRPGGPAGGLEPAGVIALGVRDGHEIRADIAALGGLGLTGPGAPAAARAILAGLLARAVPGQGGGPAEVIVPAADLAVLLPGWHPDVVARSQIPGLIITPTADAALSQAEAILVRRARMAGTGQASDTPPGAVPALPLPVAVLIAAPAPAATWRLRAVLESGLTLGLAAILLGAWPPGVTCHVAADGTLESADPALHGGQLFHLGDADTAAVISLLQTACAEPATGNDPHPAPPGPPSCRPAAPPPPPLRSARAPAGGGPATPTSRPAGIPLLPAPAAPAPQQPAGPAALHPDAQHPATDDPRRPDAADPRVIRVEVLGPLRITAGGQEISGGLRKARELLAFLAVHPAGATPDAISEALWPESPPGHGAAQRNLALRKARTLLRAAAGLTEPMLIVLAAGRYRLDPATISTDIADFQAALEQARLAPDDSACLAACQKTAALYRGPLADGAGYDWTEPYAETARRRALDAWTRIAEILEPASPGQALAALETALGHDPYNEYLYQRIMRLQAAAGRPDAARRTMQLLETRLAELGLSPDPATQQAAQEATLPADQPPSPVGSADQ
jgi:DNA-binding SARP family transcriptional activator